MKTDFIQNGRKFLIGAFVLSLFTGFLLSGCKVAELFSLEGLDLGEEEEESDSQKQVFTGMTVALYTGEELDPFTSLHRSNRAVLALCYDNLVELDNTFSPSSDIADFTSEGNTVTFKLRPDAVFSDGTRITAEDCAYSLRRAQLSDSVYAVRLSGAELFTVTDSYTLTVKFLSDSRFNVNLLTVPVVKAVGKTAGFYTGSGRYYPSLEDGTLCLRGRTDGKYAEPYEFTRIGLFETDDTGELTYNFNYGKIYAAYADLSSGTVRYKGNVELVSFPTLDMVYAVLNGSKDYLASAAISQAISYAIDRRGLCETAFSGLASPTWQPFCPGWAKTAEAMLNDDIYAPQTAADMLTEAGFEFSGTVRSWKKQPLTLNLICNSESVVKAEVAELLASSLRSIGFDVNVSLLQWNDYTAAISEGNFDIYLGETVLTPDMNINIMLNTEKFITFRTYPVDEYGFSSIDRLKSNTESFLRGDTDMRTVVADFFELQPFIPLYYTRGALAVNRTVNGDFLPSEENIYNNIETWYED